MRIKKIFRGLSVLFAVLLVVAHFISFLNPHDHRFAYPCSLSIPFLLGINLLSLILNILFHRKITIVFFIVLISLVVAFGEIKATFTISFGEYIPEKNDISVLSYNAQVFNVYKHLSGKGYENSFGIIKWLTNNPFDVMCFQEYYSEPGSPIFDMKKRFSALGYKYAHTSIAKITKIESVFGLAIFSKWPIIKSQTIHFEDELHQNRGHFVDIVKGKDTLRIINIHFESYSGRRSFLSEKNDNQLKMVKYFFETASKRATQVGKVLKEVKNSPYEVILCGDFNSLVYEYPYKVFKDELSNAFEEKGNGLGLTRYGRPFPIRIDNQFFSDGLQIKAFKTINNLRYSDHVPIIGIYSCN